MKTIVNRIVLLVVIGVITSVSAWSKTIKKEVTFKQSLTVNGTLVKKGTYKVAFNDETNELTISKGKEIIATAQARLEKTNERYTFYTHAPSADPTKAPTLVAVSLKEGNLATLIDSTAASSRP